MKYYKVKLVKHGINQQPNCSFSQAYYRWCNETFGAPFQGKLRKECKGWAEMRWYLLEDTFYFANEADAAWFLLKWA